MSILHGLQLVLTNSPDVVFFCKNNNSSSFISKRSQFGICVHPELWVQNLCTTHLKSRVRSVLWTTIDLYKKTTDQINERKLPKGRKYPGFCSRSSRLEGQRLHQIRAPPEFQQPWASQLDPTLQPYGPSEPNKPIITAA